MHLEQDRREPKDPAHIDARLDADVVGEWEWRQNFRVWQANRKVFLYPETYIEPGNRDDKTPLFDDLESSLLQQPINEQNVLDAYAAYLSGFDEISKLKIAGSYHDIVADQNTQADILHLFGVTSEDPPRYYYRTIEGPHYGETEPDLGVAYNPWQPIKVQIPATQVAPVVYLNRLFLFWTNVTTKPKNLVQGGGSRFTGYQHTMKVSYSSLRLDGTWTAPQPIMLSGPSIFPSGDGIVDDPLTVTIQLVGSQTLPVAVTLNSGNDLATLDAAVTIGWQVVSQFPKYDAASQDPKDSHWDPKDGYTLVGFQWDRVYPQVRHRGLAITCHNFQFRGFVDFYNKRLNENYDVYDLSSQAVLCSREATGHRELYAASQSSVGFDFYPWCSIVAQDDRIQDVSDTISDVTLPAELKANLYLPANLIAEINLPAEIGPINSSIDRDAYASIIDAVIDNNGDTILLQGSARPADGCLVTRLGTTLGQALCSTLFTSGVDGLLQIGTQKTLGEEASPVAVKDKNIIGDKDDKVAGVVGKIDFTGSLGNYFREIFCHAPSLIADQHNAQGNFAESQRWYNYIFDPTADDGDLDPKEDKLDRVWRYLAFRNLDRETLQHMLTYPPALTAYRNDPFNPHAIARLRPNAYQKAIVMKYIDNLLDWGDQLFTEFTMESVNEATLLYVTAQEILGPRPAEVGDCGEGDENERTYAAIAPLLYKDDDFVVEMETFTFAASGAARTFPKSIPNFTYAIAGSYAGFYLNEAVNAYRQPAISVDPSILTTDATAPVRNAPAVDAAIGIANPIAWNTTRTSSWGPAKGKGRKPSANHSPVKGADSGAIRFPWTVARQILPAFCIPPNEDLLAYWDRVEDRLWKIRHCRDITGARRQLALFAPPIDPRLLVEAKAAGLSLEDVLGATSGDLPPYRFAYLIEKAKQYASQVQSFGAALLAAIEKRDAQHLEVLRQTQQQNILTMTTNMRLWDVDTAQNAVDALSVQLDTVTARRDYFQGLIDAGLNTAEHVQSVAQQTANVSYGEAPAQSLMSSLLHLTPRVGSPFAMTYGGQELGDSAQNAATFLQNLGRVAELIAGSAGLQAGFDRRAEGWHHEVDMANGEIAQINKQLVGANIRLKIAQRSLDIHNKTIDQGQQILDLYRSRFSNLGLYTWLSTNMQTLYRHAYAGAYAMARLAEQAYRFERNDEMPLLSGNYFSPRYGGLLAGETLLAELQDLERRFIETNYRTLEIDQSFSLAQIAPHALANLREKATCAFTIPEVFFDLSYPGQYRRRIKAVRLTIPCVTGPYTNVSATLTLTESQIRLKPELGANPDVVRDVPLRRSVAIATSTAQNDTGVFEFSFRDERYMPFEGAGAAQSSWRIDLPNTFRQFDYETMTDVILRISYSAEQDGDFRVKVEGAIESLLQQQKLYRLFSLRQEFPSTFNRLLHSAANTPVTISIGDKHLPFFLRRRSINPTAARLVLRTPQVPPTPPNATIAFDGASGTDPDTTPGGLWSFGLSTPFGLIGDHTLAVVDAGDLAPLSPPPGDVSAIDEAKLLDVLLYVEYELA
jgi:hypothetical protein